MFSYKIEICYVSQRPLNMPCEVSTLSYPHTESIKALHNIRVIYSRNSVAEKCIYPDNLDSNISVTAY